MPHSEDRRPPRKPLGKVGSATDAIMDEAADILSLLDEHGLTHDQPIMLATMALRGAKGDWAQAQSNLRAHANRFAMNGDERVARIIAFSAKIVRFYGRGY